MKRTSTYIGLLILVLILLAFAAREYAKRETTPSSTAVTSTSSFLCRDGKTIDASFSANSVLLTLSDTRSLVLPQVVSGSGIRYEKGSVSFVSKGDNAFLEENGTQTFVDCVANSSAASSSNSNANGMKQFTDSAGTFSFMYPSTLTVTGGDTGYTTQWMNNATTSGLTLVKATLGKSYQPNTNFSEGTFTVGTSPDPTAVATCLTYNPTGGPAKKATTQTVNGTTYIVFTEGDAGAGNLYETTSYRTVRNNQCYAIEYTIHSTNIGNYSPDQGVKAYDANAVNGVFTSIINSFRFTDGA